MRVLAGSSTALSSRSSNLRLTHPDAVAAFPRRRRFGVLARTSKLGHACRLACAVAAVVGEKFEEKFALLTFVPIVVTLSATQFCVGYVQ